MPALFRQPLPLLAAAGALAALGAAAQTPPPPAAPGAPSAPSAPSTPAVPAARSSPATAATPPARAASAAAANPAAATPTALERMQITGSTVADPDTLERRRSTASRIVVGREEIDRFGDSNLGEVLKRLPGVTVGGPPGRGGGGPRMRGLGSGYTQLLINGERIPMGFSLESLTPEQVERIEILRAPTAEYGARAIAGTINIVLREALQKRLNDLRIGTNIERGRASPGVSWTRNDKLGETPGSTYNLSLNLFRREGTDPIDTRSRLTDLATGNVLQEQLETGRSVDDRQGLNLSSRLQWRFGGGDSLSLQSALVASEGGGGATRSLTQTGNLTPPPYATADGRSDSRFAMGRANLQWQQRLDADTKLDLRAGAHGWRSTYDTRRHEADAAGVPTRELVETGVLSERTFTTLGKVSRELFGDHSLVAGWDAEYSERSEQRSTLQNGAPLLAAYGNELNASARRVALYAQDEWSMGKQWSMYAGLRWERIDTRSDNAALPVARHSAVWTPLFQTLWKPDENSRDQVRLALTRSYKSPTLRNLVARPTLSTRYPAPGANTASTPDSVGNPDLRPELATGIDLAWEHYLGPAGGLLSVNLFHRRISGLIRNVTQLQTVPWATVPRWVSRVENFGRATTEGVELEAKGRLNEFGPADWPAVSVRSNLSVFRSKVEGVQGPDNRLDEQPAATANLGADYRFRGLPLSLGGTVNWTPQYTVQRTTTQRSVISTKRSLDAFAKWDFGPSLSLRVGATNLAPADYVTTGSVDVGTLRDSTETHAHTATQWSLRLEMKL